MSKENLYTKDCIRTFTGKYVNVFEPTPEMICIEDIAHALSNQCRFGGHLPHFYSVAQHSLCVAALSADEHKLGALLHDASEAYLLDIPRPIKQRLTNYKEIEDRLMKLISKKFGFKYPLHESVKHADEVMLQKEWDEIMIGGGSETIFHSPDYVKRIFLATFKIYTETPNTPDESATSTSDKQTKSVRTTDHLK